MSRELITIEYKFENGDYIEVEGYVHYVKQGRELHITKVTDIEIADIYKDLTEYSLDKEDLEAIEVLMEERFYERYYDGKL